MARNEDQPRRRIKWWMVATGALALLIIGGALWVFRYRIQRMLEPAATLPPPPPTQTTSSEGDGAAEGVLYQTDFEEAAAEWETFDDGVLSAEIRDGGLVVGVDAVIDRGGWSGLNFSFDDFVAETEATKLEGPDDNAIMVIFRLTDTENYNRFDISSDGWYMLTKVRDGMSERVSDWMQSEAINTGDGTNVIRVEAVGDQFRFAVNGEPLELCISYEEGVQPIPLEDECAGGAYVDVWENDDIARGKIGLGVQGYVGIDEEGQTTTAHAVVAFDNVMIIEP